MKGQPRVQGKIGTIEDGEHKGKWACTVWLSFMGEPTEPLEQTIGPFDSEDIAKKELKKLAQFMCVEIEKAMTGKSKGNYIDLKTNKFKNWNKAEYGY